MYVILVVMYLPNVGRLDGFVKLSGGDDPVTILGQAAQASRFNTRKVAEQVAEHTIKIITRNLPPGLNAILDWEVI